MTRGRQRNTAHLVAETVDDARRQWVAVFGRDRADLGPSHAAGIAAEAIDRYGPMRQPYIRRVRRPAPPRQSPPAPAPTPARRHPVSTPPPSLGL
jgi:hypothetical protein